MKRRLVFIASIAILALTVLGIVGCGAATPAPPRHIETFTSNVEILDQYEIPVKAGGGTRNIGITVFYDKNRDLTCLLSLNWYSGETNDLECFEGKRNELTR